MILLPKDGISMITGNNFIMALGAEAAARAQMVVNMADVVAATSVEGRVVKLHIRAYSHKLLKLKKNENLLKISKLLICSENLQK